MTTRCEWPTGNELMMKYHDEEWGMPVHDDRELFEFIVLESAQAGLSWQTILNRREGYRKAFVGFDYEKVAKFGDKDVERLMQDVGIIRNRLKIVSTISNAQNFIKIIEEFGSFDKYIWGFVNGKQIVNDRKKLSDFPANTEISDKMCKDLKARGFKFVGSTIMYAFMQSVGMVNDHVVDCYRYRECQEK